MKSVVEVRVSELTQDQKIPIFPQETRKQRQIKVERKWHKLNTLWPLLTTLLNARFEASVIDRKYDYYSVIDQVPPSFCLSLELFITMCCESKLEPWPHPSPICTRWAKCTMPKIVILLTDCHQSKALYILNVFGCSYSWTVILKTVSLYHLTSSRNLLVRLRDTIKRLSKLGYFLTEGI